MRLCAKLLRSYVKIRTLVSRHGGGGKDALSAMRRSRTQVCELPMLRAIAKKLQGKRRLFKLLPKLQKTSKNRWDQESVNAFIWESFRANAVCHKAARYIEGVPRDAVPEEQRGHAMYGRGASQRQARDKHKTWAKLCARPLCERHRFRATPEDPLTDARLRQVLPCGQFNRLQILTDLREAGGSQLVTIPENLGDGVKFEDTPLAASDLVDIVAMVNEDTRFRENFGGSLRIDTAGHLICELRQAVRGGWSARKRTAFFQEMQEGYTNKKRPREAELREKEACCRDIADYCSASRSD